MIPENIKKHLEILADRQQTDFRYGYSRIDRINTCFSSISRTLSTAQTGSASGMLYAWGYSVKFPRNSMLKVESAKIALCCPCFPFLLSVTGFAKKSRIKRNLIRLKEPRVQMLPGLCSPALNVLLYFLAVLSVTRIRSTTAIVTS